MKAVNFSKNLRQLRTSKGLTQGNLAVLLNVDQRTVSAWENDVCEPSLTLLVKLSELFEETLDGLIL